MKTRSIFFTALCSLMLGTAFIACSDDDEEIRPVIDPVLCPAYILNEGTWGGNNANVSSFVPTVKGLAQADVYQSVNGKKLGDLANDMTEEDNQIFVVVSGSKYVVRLDALCNEKARFTIPAGEGEPRCVDVEDGYVYVTQYGGQVSKLDAETMTRVATYNGGDNLEGIIEKNGKLYVSNAYKVDGSGGYVYNKEVIVIDAASMKKDGSVAVVENPGRIYEIDDVVYVLSAGNYKDVESSLQRIDLMSRIAVPITKADKITAGNNDFIFGVRSEYDANYQLTNSFFVYNTKTGMVSNSMFVKDAPASFQTAAIYLLEVDEETGCIYVGTSDYITNGTIYQFDRGGTLLQSFDSGGINPSSLVFLD